MTAPVWGILNSSMPRLLLSQLTVNCRRAGSHTTRGRPRVRAKVPPTMRPVPKMGLQMFSLTQGSSSKGLP